MPKLSLSNKKLWHKKIKQIKKCPDCQCEIAKKSTRCRKCSVKYKDYSKVKRKTKIDWPSRKELLEMTKSFSKAEIARKLGVSETAVRRRLKKKE